MASMTLYLPDPDATDRLATALAPLLRAGDAVLLSGDLGAGKSHLARRIIQSRQAPHGRVEDVPSPTYTLVQTYEADGVEMIHADLYRLADPSELAELGLDDALGQAIALIEWPDRLDISPALALDVTLTPEGEGRQITIAGPDAAWAERLSRLKGALGG